MEKEELEILEYVFHLAIGECYSCEIAEIGKLEEKIGTILYQYKKQKEIIDKIKKLIKQYGKYDGQKCTRGFQMWAADFNKLLQLLEDKEETDINVGEV